MTGTQTLSGPKPRINPHLPIELDGGQRTALSALDELRKAYVTYPLLTEALTHLNELKAMASFPGSMGTSASVFLLTGPSGSGKSRLLQMFAARYPRDTTGENGDVSPVVYVQLSGNCTRSTLIKMCLNALHVRYSTRATAGTLMELLLHHLREQKVEILIIDEANHLMNLRDQALDYEAADVIKTILNEQACSMVVSGLPATKTIFSNNSQLERRVGKAIDLSPFFKSEQERKVFGLTIKRYAEHVKEKTGIDASCLHVPLNILRLQHHSDGLPPRAFDIIFDGVKKCIFSRSADLTLDTLHEVAEAKKVLKDEDWENPFEMQEENLLVNAYSKSLRDTGRAIRISRRKREPKLKDVGL